MFDNLMAEVQYLRSINRVPGILEGIEYILDNEELYPSEIRRELKLFMRQGAMLFAEKETV
jgi:hypothetical protein